MCRFAQAGQIVGLIGENGAGKSTMIKNITRHLKPQQGQITIDGTRVSEISNEDFPVSYIPEIPVFYEELTVIEHLHFIKALYPENTQSIPAIVAHFELEEHINKVPSALSRGTKQKLMIAMALMRAYRILIADEPFTGLDPKQIRLLKETMLQHKKDNKLVLLSTHLLDMVESYAISTSYSTKEGCWPQAHKVSWHHTLACLVIVQWKTYISSWLSRYE